MNKKLAIDPYEIVARHKLKVGVDYEWSTLEAIGPDMLVTLMQTTEYKSGKKKGQKKYLKKTALRACVTKAECLRAELGDYP